MTTTQKLAIGLGAIGGVLALYFLTRKVEEQPPPIPGTATLQTAVIDAETRRLIEGVEVRIDGLTYGYTDSEGTLIIQGLTLGYHLLSLRHIHYGDFDVWLKEGWNQMRFEI